MRNLKLRSGEKIPILGLGTWNITGKKAVQIFLDAIEIGYRHFDSADFYGNHQELGKAINKSGLKREEFFITTKVWKGDLAYDNAIETAKRFLDELQTDYLDLLLVHWPNPNIPIEETADAFIQIKNKGIAKSLGVSNFSIDLLKKAIKAGFIISNNQVEFHPSDNKDELKKFCDKNHITVTAYSPLGRGSDLSLDIIKKLSQKYKKSEAEVIINWLLQKNIITIPKASKKEHLKENFNTLNWQLNKKDLREIDNI